MFQGRGGQRSARQAHDGLQSELLGRRTDQQLLLRQRQSDGVSDDADVASTAGASACEQAVQDATAGLPVDLPQQTFQALRSIVGLAARHADGRVRRLPRGGHQRGGRSGSCLQQFEHHVPDAVRAHSGSSQHRPFLNNLHRSHGQLPPDPLPSHRVRQQVGPPETIHTKSSRVTPDYHLIKYHYIAVSCNCKINYKIID